MSCQDNDPVRCQVCKAVRNLQRNPKRKIEGIELVQRSNADYEGLDWVEQLILDILRDTLLCWQQQGKEWYTVLCQRFSFIVQNTTASEDTRVLSLQFS